MTNLGGACWTKSEPILSKIQRILRIESRPAFPPASASLRRAKQKNFLYIFLFARARFLLPRLRRGFGEQVKGKENFFAGLCSWRAGWRGFVSARARRNSPHTPLPPRPRFRRRFFSAAVLFEFFRISINFQEKW